MSWLSEQAAVRSPAATWSKLSNCSCFPPADQAVLTCISVTLGLTVRRLTTFRALPRHVGFYGSRACGVATGRVAATTGPRNKTAPRQRDRCPLALNGLHRGNSSPIRCEFQLINCPLVWQATTHDDFSFLQICRPPPLPAGRDRGSHLMLSLLKCFREVCLVVSRPTWRPVQGRGWAMVRAAHGRWAPLRRPAAADRPSRPTRALRQGGDSAFGPRRVNLPPKRLAQARDSAVFQPRWRQRRPLATSRARRRAWEQNRPA